MQYVRVHILTNTVDIILTIMFELCYFFEVICCHVNVYS